MPLSCKLSLAKMCSASSMLERDEELLHPRALTALRLQHASAKILLVDSLYVLTAMATVLALAAALTSTRRHPGSARTCRVCWQANGSIGSAGPE